MIKNKESITREEIIEVGRSQNRYGLIDHIKDFGLILKTIRNHWKDFN